MRAQCIAHVSQVLGRSLTQAEARGIEERVRAGMRGAARRDLAAFQAMSVPQRLAEGARIAAAEIRQEAHDARVQAQKAVAVHDANAAYLDEWERAGGDLQDGIDRMLLNNADGRSRVQSLESKVGAVFADYGRRLTTAFELAHPRLFGLLRDAEGAALVTRELFQPGSTGNAVARRAAEEWGAVVDSMVAQFKAAGGVLHRLADWRFPQHHDQGRVFEAGVDAWTAAVMPKLDRSRYVNENGRLMTDQELEALVRGSWESIASGGSNKIEAGGQVGATKVANRYTDHRVLHFRDADGWLEYQAAFGGGDLWTTMTGHIHRMSRDIALLEHFGPNPEAELRYWQDYAEQKSGTRKTNAAAVRRRIDEAYRQVAGQTDGVHNAVVAAVFDNVRNVLSASRLGSAVISSIPDLATMLLTARYNRLSGLDVYANSLKAFTTEGREQLQQAGLMVESALASLRRFQVDALGPTYSARLADATMRAQGLTRWTDALRGGFAASQMHSLARLARSPSLAVMDAADRRILEAAGVTDADLAVWRAAGTTATKFGDLLTVNGIYAVPDAAIAAIPVPVGQATRSAAEARSGAAQKLLGMLLSESHMAVVEPGARERLQMGSGRPRGEIKGELLRSFWQFKSFPWALFQKHVVQRGWGGHDTAGGRATYVAGLTIASTLLGALAMEINDMLTGKDPRPLWGDDPKVVARNWGAAFVKGGALGIYGDFLASEASPVGQTPIATLLGPTGGLVESAFGLTVGNAMQAAGGRDTNAGAEAARFVKGVTPGANLWYAKAALDHLIWNQITDALSPGHLERVRQRSEREFGSTSWWRPADVAPERAPRIENIGGRQ